MADESLSLKKAGGGAELTGKIVSRVDQRQPRAAGFFSTSEPDVWMFRVQDDHTGQVVPVRFEGPINSLLDQGDHVYVQGYLAQGVLNARKIRDDQGAVLAQAKCFVATAAFGTPFSPEVEILRRFRDEVLSRSATGRWLMAWYWRLGPRWAAWLEDRPAARRIVRQFLLVPLCRLLASRVGMAGSRLGAAKPPDTNRPF
jgi:hypothetical protein